MKPGSTSIRVEVDVGTPAEQVLADWLRGWRRRGVRVEGKPTYLLQGASVARCFNAPQEAIAELERRLLGVPSGVVKRMDD